MEELSDTGAREEHGSEDDDAIFDGSEDMDDREREALFEDIQDMDDLDRAMEEGHRGQASDDIAFPIALPADEGDDFAVV